jgi:hypothetical protein
MLDREVARITQADELLGWIMSQAKRRECDGGRNRFEVARRNGDDQAFDLALPDLLENVGHGANVPIEMKLFTRHHGLKGPADKGYELAPQQFVDDCPLGRRT